METLSCKDAFKTSDSSVSYFQNFTNLLPGMSPGILKKHTPKRIHYLSVSNLLLPRLYAGLKLETAESSLI